MPLTNPFIAKKLCATAPVVVEKMISLHVRTPKRVTPESMLASPHIFKTLDKPRATLKKVLTALVSPGSTRKKTVTPKVTRIARPRQTLLPNYLGECISRDAAAVSHLGWEEFVRRRRGRGDFSRLEKLRHLAQRLLR